MKLNVQRVKMISQYNVQLTNLNNEKLVVPTALSST